MAGMEGVEPPLTEPESAVLPLDDIPMTASLRSAVPLRKKEIYGKFYGGASPFLTFLKIGQFAPTHEGPVKPNRMQGAKCRKRTIAAVGRLLHPGRRQ